jgi:sec-independent protein translocase protein TatC
MSTAAANVGVDDDRMSLMEHLTELRDRIIKVVLAVLGGMVIAFLLYNQIFDFLLGPYEDVVRARPETALDDSGRLLQIDPLEGFGIRMKLAAYGGIAIAMPVILWQLWRFITPGLYPHEKRYAIPFLASALALFVLGAGLAYTTLPRALEFLVDIGGSDNFVTAFQPGKYFTLITYMMLAFGIGFEFPILLIFLQMAGIISPDNLRSARRFAIVGICILVAVITPSGDPISMLMLSGPMVLFYEAAIIVGRVMARRRKRAAAAAT